MTSVRSARTRDEKLHPDCRWVTAVEVTMIATESQISASDAFVQA